MGVTIVRLIGGTILAKTYKIMILLTIKQSVAVTITATVVSVPKPEYRRRSRPRCASGDTAHRKFDLMNCYCSPYSTTLVALT